MAKNKESIVAGSEVLMSRKGPNVDISGIKMTIPETHSMIGLFNENNLIEDGLAYEKDGWIYKNGKRFRKWFGRAIQGFGRIWEPNLDPQNISKLEDSYQRSIRMSGRFYAKKWVLIKKIYEKGSPRDTRYPENVIAHCKPTHKYTGEQNKYWQYSIGPSCLGKGISFHFDWCDKKPRKLVNHAQGQRLYEMDMHSRTVSGRCALLREALSICIGRRLKTETPEEGKIVRLVINERDYWYQAQYQGPSYLGWVKLAWPTDKTVTVKA